MGVWRETFCFETNKKIFHCGWYIIMFYTLLQSYTVRCVKCAWKEDMIHPKQIVTYCFQAFYFVELHKGYILYLHYQTVRRKKKKRSQCVCVFWRENDHLLLPPQLIRPVATQLTNNIDQILREHCTLLTCIYQSKKTHPNKQQRFHHLSFQTPYHKATSCFSGLKRLG